MRRLEKYGSFFAILFSSLLFGVMHGNLAQIFFAAAAGLIFGYLAMEYSIVWSILLHILNNLVFSDLLGRFTEHLPETAANLISYGMMGIFTVIACVLLYKKERLYPGMLKANPYTQKVLSLGLYRILVPAICSSGIYRCFCSTDRCSNFSISRAK